jgi:hypothetical protein
MENKDSNLIEQIIDLSASFFVYVLENVLSSEKKKLDKDNNQSGIENVNHKKVEEVNDFNIVFFNLIEFNFNKF